MIEQTNSDHQGELLHYVKKAAILRSIVHGEDATALCGEQFLAYPVATGGRGNEVQICPACSEIHAGLAVFREEAVANA